MLTVVVLILSLPVMVDVVVVVGVVGVVVAVVVGSILGVAVVVVSDAFIFIPARLLSQDHNYICHPVFPGILRVFSRALSAQPNVTVLQCLANYQAIPSQGLTIAMASHNQVYYSSYSSIVPAL